MRGPVSIRMMSDIGMLLGEFTRPLAGFYRPDQM